MRLPPLALIEREIARRDAERDRAKLIAEAASIRARCSTLIGFVREFWTTLEPVIELKIGWAVEAIALHLEAVSDGRIQYLLINVPPGMMKSLLVSVFWPAWEWATRNASLGYLTSSFALENVTRDNNKMRTLVESEKFQAVFPGRVVPGSKWGERRFENKVRGVRAGRSFRKMTGGRGDRVLIDDPHDVDAGESDVQRPAAVKTFREAIPDRLNDMTKSAIVVIMQRLHANDVAGTILQLKLPYVHLNLPMEYESYRMERGIKVDARCVTYDKFGVKLFEDPRTEDGELLFPERFPREVVEGLKIAKGSYAYNGQYQQRPVSREGGLFKREWFSSRIVDQRRVPTSNIERCRGWDFASTEETPGKQPDWTAGVRMLRHGGDYYVEGIARDRTTPGAVQAMVKSFAETDPVGTVIRFPIDPGQAGEFQKVSYVEALAGYRIKPERPIGNKSARAEPAAIQAENQRIWLVNSGPPEDGLDPWIELFLDELTAFPKGSFDDQVDAFADAFNELSLGAPADFSAQSAGTRLTVESATRDRRYQFADIEGEEDGFGFGSAPSLSVSQGVSW